MRSGDTDYLRFILRYLAVRRTGCLPPIPTGVAHPDGEGANGFPNLCSNMDVQTDEFKEWARNFAGLFAAHVEFPPGVTVEEVAVLLAKIRANSLGFPFTTDGTTTLGWCLHSAASRFNHACTPNCCVVAAPDDGALRGALLVATKKVRMPACLPAIARPRPAAPRTAHPNWLRLHGAHACCLLMPCTNNDDHMFNPFD
jgi:hypothetical protein